MKHTLFCLLAIAVSCGAVAPARAQKTAAPTLRIATGVSPKPSINGPRVVGTTPGKPFVFLVPASGEGPLTFSAKNLPEGLTLDEKTGIISGSLKQVGTTEVTVTLKGAQGTATRALTIVGGDHRLALTPPMGWNSWNVWGTAVDAEKIRNAADWLVKSGLAAHGFRYINIDDAWEAGRDANGEIQTNEKFGDMKALADYVHSKGLLLGIYSSPGPKTCGGYEGSFGHELQDAKTYARWGIDYLKYDWCSYKGDTRSLVELQKPYRVMREALDTVDRDIVLSLCQYGMGNVSEWGGEVGGNLWRTTGDIVDRWSSVSKIGFRQNGLEKHAGPGRWNDPDMLVVGKVGWGPRLHDTNLTTSEQITHITLWSMLAAPLLIGCDLTALDSFTLDLLTNDDVLDVDQDALGKQAWRVSQEGMTEVWARPLADGTIAVALFNKGPLPATATARWVDLGIKGNLPVRDLWQRKDVGESKDVISAAIPRHGAMLYRVGKPGGSAGKQLAERYDKFFAANPVKEATLAKPATPGVHKLNGDGFVDQWLIAGPFSLKGGTPTDTGLGLDHLNGEAAYTPERDAEVTRPDGKKVRWAGFASAEESIDFFEVSHLGLTRGDPGIAAFGACWLEVEADIDVDLKLGSDDGYKLWLDHKEIATVPLYRAAAPDQETYRVRLTKGKHLLMIKVTQGTGDFGFYVRVVTPDGQPAPVKVWT
jgi:alpha-galactosidase